MSRVGWGAVGVLLAAVCGAQGAPVQPGAVNFVEGQAAIDGSAITPGALEGVVVAAGQTLSTENGKAEALLLPGVFLRIADQTAVKMTSLAPADVQVELLHGEALLEVVQLGSGRLQVVDDQARVTVEHPGIYEFHASQAAIAVISGKARVVVNDHATELGKDRQFTLRPDGSGQEGKLASTGDALYAWSRQRALARPTRNRNGWTCTGLAWKPWRNTGFAC